MEQIGNGRLEAENRMAVFACMTGIYNGYMTESNCKQKVIISRFHTSPEYEANKLGYRVVSWNGRKVEEEQIGMLTLVDRADIYWQAPNGQLTKVKTVLPNERYAVYSKRKDGIYYIGNNLYIVDETGEKIRYEQIPSSVLSNIYKRKYNVPL